MLVVIRIIAQMQLEKRYASITKLLMVTAA